MPTKKSNVATGKQLKQRVQEALSPPPTVLRQPAGQSKTQTPQLSDESGENTPYVDDEEATPTPNPANPTRSSIPFEQRSTSEDKNPQYLEIMQQLQQQLQ